MTNIKATKEIIPWTCHVCGRQFATPDGGICLRCNQATCKRHLHHVGKKLKLESAWVCDNCLTAEEKTGKRKKLQS